MTLKKSSKKRVTKKQTTSDNVKQLNKQPSINSFKLRATTFFLTYKGLDSSGTPLTKENLANFLLHQNPHDRTVKPDKYFVCQQTYESGQPHFHVILIYSKRKQIIRPDFYDYLGVHPNIQTMRNMKAALNYVCKQDTCPVTNMNLVQQSRIARAQHSSSLYQLLYEQMLKDPFHFNVYDYCKKHSLSKQIYKANFTKAISLLKPMQLATCRAILKDKPGLQLITPSLISQNLNDLELTQYYSHPCYQKIVDHINQIITNPNLDSSSVLPIKTPHLLIVGDSDIGKSALLEHRPHGQFKLPGLSHYYPLHYITSAQRFHPPYQNYAFSIVAWNQFVLNSPIFPKSIFNYLLDYLAGNPASLIQKGLPPYYRQDNPKHILNSNRTLEEHITHTFRSEQSRASARMSLRARIDQVIVPQGKKLHFLRKLFVAAPKPTSP